MIESRYPGVFLTEVPFNAKPIDGVATSTPSSHSVGKTALERLAEHVAVESPAWTDANQNDPGVTQPQAFAWLGESLAYRAVPELKHVGMQRYLTDLNESIDKGIQFARFEPNGEALWGNVRAAIEDFLFNQWQSGALRGERPEQAYFVKCDRTTMSQNDLDNGRLVVLVGVATTKPAEFVILRFSVKTASAGS